MLTQIGHDLAVARRQEPKRTTAESRVPVAQRQHAPGPVEQRMGVSPLRFDIHCLIAVERVHDRWQHETGRIALGKAAIAVRRPLHRGAHAVAVAEIDIVAHADFVAIIDDRRTGHGQEQRIHQFDPPPVTFHQRSEAPADTEIDAGATVCGIGVPEVIALLVGHHFQRQLVMVPQEDRPLAVFRNFRRLAHDVGDRETVFLGNGHVHARHQRKMKRHVALVAITEIFARILRPLVGFGEQHFSGMALVECRTNALQDVMRFGQVLVIRALALDQIGDRVQPKSVDAGIGPITHHLQKLFQHGRIVEVEIRLMRIKPMPVIRAGHRIPGPVRLFRIEKDDPGFGEFLVSIGPDIEIPFRRTRRRMSRPLEPGMLIRRVVDDELDDDPDSALVCGFDKRTKILHRAIVGADIAVVCDVITIVAARRGKEGQEPDRISAERGDVIELFGQPLEVAYSVAVRVVKRLHMQLVDDRILVP
ncbi:hypothetical protein D3C73_559410 [compost metagenome]